RHQSQGTTNSRGDSAVDRVLARNRYSVARRPQESADNFNQGLNDDCSRPRLPRAPERQIAESGAAAGQNPATPPGLQGRVFFVTAKGDTHHIPSPPTPRQ